jgi:hypothetical protein
MRSTLHDPLLTAEQAYTDAESGCESVDARESTADGDGDGPPERLRARLYLRGDNKQEAAALAMVCGFAEVPADRVLNWARKNYPRPKLQAQTQNALAISASEAQHNRARTCEHATA